MQVLGTVDYSLMAVYFCFILGLGFVLTRKAAGSMEDYFLGGKSVPWWLMGTSGMASFLDMTGTMIIVSFLFLLGPRGYFIEFRGGAVLILPFLMCWAGKWHRRSNCMTGAEWNIYRFGPGKWSETARVIGACGALMASVAMIAYLVKGSGLFLSMFIDMTPNQCAAILIGIATVYTMFSGFYGVVYTDFFQSFIILIAVVWVSIIAFTTVGSVDDVLMKAQEVTTNDLWTSSIPSFSTHMPAGYEMYEALFMYMIFYFIRNVLGGMAGGAEPKYFGARNERECGKLTFLWIWLMTFRWPMMMGFAVLGLYGVNQYFPDLTVLTQAAELIQTSFPDVSKAGWNELLSQIARSPENYDPGMIAGIQNLLGENFTSLIHMVSFEGSVNAERILPAVILWNIPMGLRGLIMVALIAAAMSTFDTNVNMASAFFVRDIYQRFINPKANNKKLIYVSYATVLTLVAVGFTFALTLESINDIWGWIIMGLGTGGLFAGIARLYWWRLNAQAVVLAGLIGLIIPLLQRVFFKDLGEIHMFCAILAISTVVTVVATYCFPPTNPEVLKHFYKTTRPFGFWGPVKGVLSEEKQAETRREHFYDIVSLPFAMGWQITLFLLPMQVIIHAWTAFFWTLPIFLVCLAGVIVFWYRNLPPDSVPLDHDPFHTHLTEKGKAAIAAAAAEAKSATL